MIEVSIRELKSHLSAHLRRLEQGETITVTRRGKPVALISPAEPAEDELTRKMRELVARGVISWSGQKPLIPKKRIRLIGAGPTMSEMVIADRG
jgi:prevent-host-death family protein